ncbi:ABC transporter substrate-binding protein [Paraburkholderia sp.]|uniref:ABC transporter substrate-binding protein n=1 Tax=Paraburkholderia sp. TaxID=1926495 RepID=UPI0023A6D5DA|nr:ABC transporter substrate-binding protein [Paraburkholderia sp.]MDE1179962.1 ABC transporter substrate-binding protein [Paraburkholderia sp.]
MAAWFRFPVLLACALTLWAPCSHAEKLTLMTGGPSKIVYLPVVLAAQLGYFRDENLDVEILAQPAGVDTATELIAGAIQGAVGFYDHTIDLQTRGQDVQSIVVFSRAAGLVVLASAQASRPDQTAPAFQSMADARGRRLGVTGFGASTYFVTRYLAQRAGVPPNAYSVVALGSEHGFVDAIGSGKVDAGMIEEPTASELIQNHGAHVLVDMRNVRDSDAALGGPYAGACLYVQVKWLDAHRDDAQRLSRALVRALNFIATHSAGQIAAVVPPQYIGVARPVYLRALAAAIPTFTRDGKMPDGAPANVLSVLAATNRAIDPQHVDLARTYTDTFVDPASASR